MLRKIVRKDKEMKRKIAMLLLSLVFAVTPATNVLADEVEKVCDMDRSITEMEVTLSSESQYVVSVKETDGRSGPGNTYSSYGKLYQDNKVSPLSIQKGWAKVRYKGKIGYISITSLKRKR